MNSYKQKIEYLAQSYIAIAKRYRNWDMVKELIERNKDTEEAVKQRIKEILGKKWTKYILVIAETPCEKWLKKA